MDYRPCFITLKSHNMKNLIILLAIVLPTMVFAQSIERQVIGSAGGSATTASLQVSYTIGETVTSTGTSSNIIITQGFQQPEGGSVGINLVETGLSVEAYPNPTSDQVILQVETTKLITIDVLLLDLLGQSTGIEMTDLEISGTTTETVDISSLPSGHYMIILQNEDGMIGTIKMHKVK